MAVVGTAYVVIRAITRGLGRDIARGVESGLGSADFSSVGRRIGAQVSRSIGEGIERDGGNLGARIGRSLAPEADRGGAYTGRVLTQSMIRSMEQRVKTDTRGRGAIGRFLSGLSSFIQGFQMPPGIWLGLLALPALGGAISILTAYVAAAVALLSTLGPALAATGVVAIGLVASLAAVGGAIAAAFIVQTPALERFKEAIAGIAPEFRVIGEAAQRDLLPLLGAAFAGLTGVIPVLESNMRGVGRAVGEVALNLANVITHSDNLRRIGITLGVAHDVTKLFGTALSGLVTSFLILSAASGPLVTQFATWLSALTNAGAASLAAAEANGSLAAFLERAGGIAATFGAIIGDTFGGLSGVFSAALPSGVTLLDTIASLAEKFNTWANSIGGQSTMAAWFEAALPIVREFNGLIGDVFRLMGGSILDSPDGVLAFIATMRDTALPVLTQLAASLGPFASSFLDAASALVTALDQSGALGAFVATITAIMQAITWLLELPFVGQLVAWGIALAGIVSAVAAVVGPLITVGTVIFRVASFIIPLLITGIRALGVAMMANPVGAVIALVVALAAALILAYNKSETFRNIVDTVGRAIRDGFITALEWLRDVWDSVWNAIQVGWNFIQTAFTVGVAIAVAVWNRLQAAFNVGVAIFQAVIAKVAPIFDAITQPIQGIVQIITGFWEIIKGIFTGNLDLILEGVSNVIGGIVRFFLGLPARIIGAIIDFVPQLIAWGQQAFVALAPIIMAGIESVLTFFRELPGKALAAVLGLAISLGLWALNTWTTVKTNFIVGVANVIAFLQGLPDRAIAAITTLIVKAGLWALNTWSTVKTNFITGVANVIAFVQGLPDRVITAVTGLIVKAGLWALNTWNTVKTNFTTGITNLVTLAQGLPGKIVTAVGNLGSKLTSVGEDLLQGLIDGINNMWDNVMDLAGELASKVKDKITDALGISSPSRVMIEIGRFVGQGLEIGMRKMVPVVGRAASGLATAAVATPPPAGFSGGGSGTMGSGTQTSGGGVVIQQNWTLPQNMSPDEVSRQSAVRAGYALATHTSPIVQPVGA